MGGAVELPCDADGVCMVCKVLPLDSDVILCNGCGSPWHAGCLVPPIMTIPEEGDWFCPDCNLSTASHRDPPPNASSSAGDGVIHQIRRLQNDSSLSVAEKARKCQDIMSNGSAPTPSLTNGGHERKKSSNKVLEMLDENLNCIFCLQLADRPVTTPCGHNFCLRCFQRWVGQGKKTCGKCRATIPGKMASQPRINSALVIAIRMAKAAVNAMETTGGAPPKPYNYIQNKDRPDKAFTTDRAKKPGKANASSGRIFVTVPPDHFGPILAENDPIRSQGVLVGETWEDRLECRQWGVHLPHVAGIAGQSDYGAQSVALSGGYQDDEDHGEWFLYTGSGGRDLSGNKRTNDKQSFDQKFDKYNQALRVSCEMGYPVRVVRSHKEKRSSYAPETGVRYDGIYRIERCWRKTGIQGFRVCRYLFVRCDNEPAPWTSDEHGDQPRPLPKIDELKGAINITERKIAPYWDWKEDEQMWGWSKTPPMSKKSGKASGGPRLNRSRLNQKLLAFRQRLLKEFSCNLCKKALTLPVSTPCGHNFCKGCMEAAFAGQQNMRQRTGVGGHSLRAQKVAKPCPSCHGDISDFLLDLKVNRQMEEVIESLKKSAEQELASSDECSVTEESSVDGGLEMRMETKQDSTSEEKVEEKEDATFVNTQEVSEVDESKGNGGDKSDLSNNSSKLDDSKGEVLDKGTEMCRSKAALAKEKSFKRDEGGDLEELDSLLTARQRQLKKPEKAQSSLSPSDWKPNGRSTAMSPKRNKKSKPNGHPAPPSKEAETDSDVEFIGEVITVTSPRTRRMLLRKRIPIEPPPPNSPNKKIRKECHK